MESLRARMVIPDVDEEIEEIALKYFYHLPTLSGVAAPMRGKRFFITVIQFIIYWSLGVFSFFQLLYTTYLLKDDLSIAAQTFHLAGGQLFGIAILCLALKRRVLEYNWRMMASNFYDYGPSFSSEHKPWISEAAKTKDRIFLLYAVLFSLCGVQLIILGPIQDNIQGFSYNSTIINGVYMRSPYPVWFPFRPSYFIAFLYEMIVFTVLILVLCTGAALLHCVCHAVAYQIRALRRSIESLEKRALYLCRDRYHDFPQYQKPIDLYKDERFVEHYKYCIAQNIEHHLVILRIRSNLDGLLRWPMFCVVVLLGINIACSIFVVIKGENRLAPLLFTVILLATELITIILICDKGQELIDESDKIFRAFYMTTQWVDCPMSVKKLMLVINEHNKQQLSYKAGGFTDINWELLGSIMNSAYSYLNLLLAMIEP